MHYNVYLYALDATEFAQRLPREADEIIAATRQRLQDSDKLSSAELDRGLEMATCICQGNLPPTCKADDFWALVWIADTCLETVEMNALIGVKSFSYIEDTGIWPLVGRWQPPFPVPRNPQIPLPKLGFVPHESIPEALLELSARTSQDPFTVNARRVFMEILESLEEDRLDLLVVIG